MVLRFGQEERLRLHVDVGGEGGDFIGGEGGDSIGEEGGGGIELFAHAVAHHTSELLYFFFPHLRTNFTLSLTARVSFLLHLLGFFRASWFRGQKLK